MSKKTYSELLTSPKWQKKRLLVLNRDNFTCQYCGDGETELHIHHTKYEKGKNAIEISEQYLLTLCRICHYNVTFLTSDIECFLYYKYIHSEIDQKEKIKVRNWVEEIIKNRMIKNGKNI